jgi:hypothetical protein
MSAERSTQALEAAARGEPLGLADLAAIWRIDISTAWRREKAGEFDQFKLRPAIGPRRYSGVLVHRYLQGEPVYEPTFAARRLRKRPA